MKATLPWMLLLLQASSVIGFDAQKVLKAEDETIAAVADPTEQTGLKTDIIHEQHQTPPPRLPGADLVDAALNQLRKIPKSPHRRARRSKSILDTVFEYVLDALPSLSASTAPPDEDNGPSTTLSGPLLQAVRQLEQAALQNNPDALYILANMNFYGHYSHPKDLSVAYNHFHTLASAHGNSTAQHMVGVFYATGLGGAVVPDQARALLYYTFAAHQGNTQAQMAVAYRHHSGISTPKTCDKSLEYYKKVADKAIKWFRAGPPGGMTWVPESHRIADEAGGVYGKGSSAASAGFNAIKAPPNSDINAAIDDVIEYRDLLSQKGDFKASFILGLLYYEGQRGLPRNLDMARKYFFMVAKGYWKKDGRLVADPKPGIEKVAARAAGYIGRMYLRGEGVEQSLEHAMRWFNRGLMHGDAQSQHSLGLMKLHGYGNSPKNIAAATELFKAAADQDWAPAQIEMGVLHLDQGGAEDVRVAAHYFELAARYGLIEAYYYLAEMSNHGVGRDKSCTIALQYYKNVAERAEPLVSSWAEANLAYENGDLELAFIEYVLAAEQGYERAQNNVAYLLDPLQSRLPLNRLLPPRPRPALLQNPRLALMYWTRSSRQSNVDAQVKMGDYYYHGIGADPDVAKAVQCYTGASEHSQSAQALWNLGWMHENGIGLNQDFHLAKRYYDQALEINDEAYLPVSLSLLKLRVRSAWNTLTHGPIHSIQDDPEPKKERSLGEWIANFIRDDPRPHHYYDDDDYVDIYGDNNPNPDGDYFDDDDLTESLLIVFLALSLVILLYYRQQVQARHRREEEARRQQQAGAQPVQPAPPPPQQDRGVFPAPGDPDLNNWVAGGIGH